MWQASLAKCFYVMLILFCLSTTQFSSESRGQYKAKAYAAAGAKSPLAPTTCYIMVLLLCQNSSCSFLSSSKQYFKLQKWHFKPGFGAGLFFTFMVSFTWVYELESTSLFSSLLILNSFASEIFESSEITYLFAR